MNALELCDELEACGQFFEDRLYRKAAKMLRQQQVRIEELEKDLYMLQKHYDQLGE